jgi:predicted ATP-dependent endonuclease of OLD family
MRITQVTIKNYRSFDSIGQTITFPTLHCALVGKNNTGKSNIFNALDLVLGIKNPSYIKLEEEDYFDSNQPIEVEVTLSVFEESDKPQLFSIPNLTKQQQGALNNKIRDGSANITFLLRRNYEYTPIEESEQAEETKDTFEIKLWGFNVFRKKEEIRKSIIRMLMVPANRDYKNELSASKWTSYGQLMKEVLENSPQYDSIKGILSNLNDKIQEVFQTEKKALLKGARIVSYVEDISFQLTKENQPSELLRNLEIFIKENTKLFNIEYVGTGTQSAIIMGILELALKSKSSRSKLFCIEEPETFIHPHGIRYLGSLIRGISSGENTQILVSTHNLSLTANFEPKEIIRVDKNAGKTCIKQAPTLDSVHFKRFIHQDNAELFFSDRVIFVEGPTEKTLFSNLDKITIKDPDVSSSDDCNFDKINVGIIRLDSVDSIVNYIDIVSVFDIPFTAIVDRDFLSKAICKTVCAKLGVTYQNSDQAKLITDLKSKKILVNTKGEIEDLFSDQDIAGISGKSLSDIQNIKSKYPGKTSKAFKEIFCSGKIEYAIKISDYYIQHKTTHPFEDIIRKLYNNDIGNLSFN